VLVLESLEHAQLRKARIYSEILGYGLSCDAYHMTQPSEKGVVKSLEQALKLTGVSVDQIDYISAHGTGTQQNDRVECAALHRVFGEQLKQIPCSSIKSMLGHTMGAAAALEAAACCMAIQSETLPPTINYENPDEELIPDFKSFFDVFENFLEPRPSQEIHFEIGRAIVGQCGTLISKVLFVKEGVNTNFAIIDAGMTELIRPALYQAYHKIENLTSTGTAKRYDVVGPICESSDTFAKFILLPETNRGDLIAIRSTGAYGEVMSSGYNLRSSVKAYFSDSI